MSRAPDLYYGWSMRAWRNAVRWYGSPLTASKVQDPAYKDAFELLKAEWLAAGGSAGGLMPPKARDTPPKIRARQKRKQAKLPKGKIKMLFNTAESQFLIDLLDMPIGNKIHDAMRVRIRKRYQTHLRELRQRER